MIKKRRLFLDIDKEEKWLNQMAQKGYALSDITFMPPLTYVFEQNDNEKYIIRIQFIDEKAYDETEYINLVKEMGAEHVGRYNKYVYFRRKESLGDFELFTDKESKIAHYNSIIRTLAVIMLVQIPLIVNFHNYLDIIDSVTNTVVWVEMGVFIFYYGLWVIYILNLLKYLRKVNKLKKDNEVIE